MCQLLIFCLSALNMPFILSCETGSGPFTKLSQSAGTILSFVSRGCSRDSIEQTILRPGLGCLLCRHLQCTPVAFPVRGSCSALWLAASLSTPLGQICGRSLVRHGPVHSFFHSKGWISVFLCRPVSHRHTLLNKVWIETLGVRTLLWVWPWSRGCSLYLVFLYSIEFSLLLTSQSLVTLIPLVTVNCS